MGTFLSAGVDSTGGGGGGGAFHCTGDTNGVVTFAVAGAIGGGRDGKESGLAGNGDTTGADPDEESISSSIAYS